MSGNIESKEEAEDKFLEIYNRNDTQKIMKRNTRLGSNPSLVKNMIIDLEHKIFGPMGIEGKNLKFKN